MEVIAAAFAIGLILAIHDRRERQALFPPQGCGYCPLTMHFDFRRRRWVHDNGKQYMPSPWSSLEHPALPGPRSIDEVGGFGRSGR